MSKKRVKRSKTRKVVRLKKTKKTKKSKKTKKTRYKKTTRHKKNKTGLKTKKVNRILVTSALPYANGSIHIGHLVEYIQTDMYVRFLRLVGENVIYCCADDTHGTPIEINAKKQGIKPEEFIAKYYKEHTKDFSAFHIRFDSYYSTNSKENKAYSDQIFLKLQDRGYISKRLVTHLYCGSCKRFLPDRYIRGTCPECNAEDQYGDVCESCGSTHKTTDLLNPKCSICGAAPIEKDSAHYFFKLRKFSKQLSEWLKENKNLQPEIVNYVDNWIKKGLDDWCISRDGPYFGFKIPGEKDKYYYVWLDAPIGYISSTANYCKKNKCNELEYWKGRDSKIVHFIGKDIIYFHFLFWPAMLLGAGFNVPDSLVVHGFLTVNGEKMSKSRGTFFTAKQFLELFDPEYLRYYYASMLSKKMADIDLNFNEFKEKINNELIADVCNFCYRILSFINKFADGKITAVDHDKKVIDDINKKIEKAQASYSNINFNDAVKNIIGVSKLGNQYFQKHEPWKLIKKDKKKALAVLGLAANILKNLVIMLKPVLPAFAEKMETQLNLKDLRWGDLGFDLNNHKVNKAEIIFRKIEKIPGEAVGKPSRDIRLKIDPKVRQLGMKAIIAQIDGVKVKKKHEGLERLKKEMTSSLKKIDPAKSKVIDDYKRIYKDISVDTQTPAEYLHGFIREKGKLPQINTVVDSYNIVSAKTMLSIGAHDLNKIKGDIALRFASNKDRYAEIGTKTVQKIPENEFVYVDEENQVLCKLNTKQGDFTKVDNMTKNVVLIVDANRQVSDQELRDAAEQACRNIVKFCGGTYRLSGKQSSGGEFPLDLKVAQVKQAKDHPDADNLFVLKIDLGKEQRTIVAGLKRYYKAKDLVGKNIIVVTNMKPAKLKGIESRGMLLTAEKGKKVILLEAPKSKPGDPVLAEGLQTSADEITIKQFAKLNLVVKKNIPLFNDKAFMTNKGPIKVYIQDGAKIL